MPLKLGLYEYIDNNRLGEWKAFHVSIKIILISGDIEIFAKSKLEQSVDRSESIHVSNVNKLIADFEAANESDNESLKKIYTEFIEKACKPDKKVVRKTRIEEDNNGEINEKYSRADEYKVTFLLKANEEIVEERERYIQEKSERLDKLLSEINLSAIEKYALNYLKDRNDKHHLLSNFTLSGIIQIATRAAYKLYYKR